MTPVLEDVVLGTDLDCQNFDLRNIGELLPVPAGLLVIDDPRLTEGRTMLDGSVTNQSIAATAAIDQSKLNLNDDMPPEWLGGEGLAAPGDLAERVANKDVPNGYAGLDTDGKIFSVHVTSGAAVGTITEIGLYIKSPLKLVGGIHYITGSGTWDVDWKPAPANSWLGTDGTPDPQNHEQILPFYVEDGAPGLSAIPASKFTSGEFAVARLPVARGMGTAHAIGIVPDPGASGDRNMYLGRDINWHHFVVNDPALAHQPKVPDVTIVLDWWKDLKAHVTIRTLLKGAFLFYRVTPQDDEPSMFQKALHPLTPDDAHITLEVNEHDVIEAYAAKTGYNNSDVETWEVITPITDLELT